MSMIDGSWPSRSHRPPAGTRDLLPLDVVQKQWVEDRLSQVFQSWGYQRIITPTLERLETLTAGGSIRPESVLQVRDAAGTVLGLRPELTASIVRAAATRMADAPLPQRLYYHGSVYSNTQRQQEFFQSGVELIGAGDWPGDIEVLLLLADCFRGLAVDSWHLIVGDVGITQALLGLLTPTAQPTIRRAIVRLDRVYLETGPFSESDRQLALQILDLRGDPASVLARLGQMPLPASQRGRLSQLRQTCQILPAHSVVLDLSLIQTFAYYTGIVFKAVCDGEIVGSGGRYDQLHALYSPGNVAQPSIGFTLLLEKLQRILFGQGVLPNQLATSSRLVVAGDAAALAVALRLAQKWRQEGRVELELLRRTPEEVEAYAVTRRIPEIVWVQADGGFHSTFPLGEGLS